MSSRFVQVEACVSIFFLFKAELYSLYVYNTTHLFIHSSTDGPLGFFSVLAIVNILLWTRLYKYLFKPLLSILWGIYLGMELINHIVLLFLIFGGTTTLISLVVAQFSIPINSTQGFHFLHILINILLFGGFLRIAILVDMRWYLLVVLTYIFLTNHNVECLFMCFLVIYNNIFD